MKTIINKLATLFALAIMVVGCNKEAIEDSMIITQGRGILVASPSKGVGSKVSEIPNAENDLGYKVSWEVGDKLYVSDEDGSSLVGVYEVKNAADITSDGSAIFQAKEESTPLLDADTKYQFLATDAEIDEPYNNYIAATRELFKEYSADVTDANNLVTSLLYSKSPLSINSGLSLSHFFSYMRVGAKIADATMPKAKFSYVDNDGVSYTQTLNLDKFNSSLIEDDTYTFNITILPATISKENPIRLEVSADGENYSTQKELAKDTKFVGGVHYNFSNVDDLLAPANNEIIVDGVTKPIMGSYFDFNGEYYACRFSSSHSDQRLSYPFNSWSEMFFKDYKEHMFEMKVTYENTGELNFDLVNSDFSPYHNGMEIESTIAGKSNGDAVEGIELKIEQEGSQVTANYIPNLRDQNYLDYKYNQGEAFTPTPATIKSGYIKSMIAGMNLFICDITLTVEFEIEGATHQRTFTITSNGEYEKEPIDESKFNNTISLNDVSKDIIGAVKIEKGDGGDGALPFVSWILSGEQTNEQLFEDYLSEDPNEPELGRYVHEIFTNIYSFSIDSSDPSSYEMLGDYTSQVNLIIYNTGETNADNISIYVEGGGALKVRMWPTDKAGSYTPTINKCVVDFNTVGDKASYKIDLDITTTIKDVEYHQVIKSEYAGTPAGVPVTGISMEPEMELIAGKDECNLYFDIKPYEAQNKNVTISSSDESVATVKKESNPYGDEFYVIPHKAGNTTITVKTEDGGYTATCEVTVLPSKIDVTPKEKIVDAKGESFEVELTTDQEWEVTDGEMYIDESQHSGTGNATITITIPENTSTYENNIHIGFDTKDRSDDASIFINQPVCTTIDELFISHPTLHLNVGEKTYFVTSTLPSYMSRSGNFDDYTWTSSNTSVATLSDFWDSAHAKYIEAVGVGTTTITAEYLGHTVTCEVTVDNIAKPVYKVGDLYPNADNPVGVVFEIDEPYDNEFVEGTRGKVVSLDRPDTDPDVYKKWELPFASDGVDEIPNVQTLMFSMLILNEARPGFDGYPAAKWCHDLNLEQGRDVNNYAIETRNVWRLPNKYEVESMLWSNADILEAAFVSVKGEAPAVREDISYDYGIDYEHYFKGIDAMACERFNSTSAYVWRVGNYNSQTRNMLHIHNRKVVLAVMEF